MAQTTIAITPGAENGIGPGVMLRALNDFNHLTNHRFYWCGDRASLLLASKRSGLNLEFSGSKASHLNGIKIDFFDDLESTCHLERQALFLRNSVDLIDAGLAHAIVTGPMDKRALSHLGDGNFLGQTEYLASRLKSYKQHPFMAFLGGPFIMSLFTTHLPIRSVPDAMDKDRLLRHLETLAGQCGRILRMNPSSIRIAVLGLNPHAGESGLLGFEEKEIIEPAIEIARDRGLKVDGPLPADGFFGYLHQRSHEELPHAVVAMFHDQGLAPYKLLARGCAVNATLGLEVPRTSPAHGTAYNLIGGTGRACHFSAHKAIEAAIDLIEVFLDHSS